MQLRHSVAITFLSTNLNTVVQFGVTIVLSRLLTPAEVGIFSITVVITGIAAVFRDFGVSSYIQREKDLTPEKIRSAMGLMLTTSWILAACLYLISDHVAAFYGQPGVGLVMRVLTISFLLVPFASFFYALLARNLQAEKQALVNGISTFAYATSCISMAYLGFSYMALAWANVINIAVTILAYIPLRPKDQPCLPSFSGWSSPAKFGSGAILAGLIERTTMSIPDLVLGKLSGPHAVGLYSRANGLVGIFQQIAGPTVGYNAVPYIASNHHSGVPLSPMLAKATAYLTALAWPAFVVTAVYAEQIIRMLYGPTWVAAAPIVIIICFQAAGRIGYSLCQASMTAIGRPYLSALSNGIMGITRLAFVFAIGMGDILTFSLALCFADLITCIVPAWLMSKYLGYSLRISLAAHIPSLKVSLACLTLALCLRFGLPPNWPDALVLPIVGLTVAVTWLACLILFHHPLLDELPALIKRLLPSGISHKINAVIEKARVRT